MEKIEISKSQLQQQLDIEMFRRMPPAAASFFVLGAFLWFYEPKNIDSVYVKFLAASIMIVNLLRIRATRHRIIEVSEELRKKVYGLIYANTTAFALSFGILSYDIGFQDYHVVAHLIAMMGLITASPFTLSYSKKVFIYFILSWLVPQTIIVLNSSLERQFTYLYVISFLVVGLYSIRQGFSYRDQFIEKATKDLQLKTAYEELTKSRKQVVEQTLMTEHANRLSALGEMAGGVAHEINNPLAVILGNIQYIERNFDKPELREKIFSAMKKAQVSVARIDRIIKSLKSLTRQSYQAPLEEAFVSAILQETLSLCEEKFKSKGVNIIVQVDSDLKVNCQALQISQILINLLNNSNDAIETLQRDEKYIRIDAFKDEDKVIVKVSNPGPEIEKSIRERLFQPFFTTKEIGKGTGLGLSISRSMALQNHGELVYSHDPKLNENQFSIILPSPSTDTNKVA